MTLGNDQQVELLLEADLSQKAGMENFDLTCLKLGNSKQVLQYEGSSTYNTEHTGEIQ